MDEHQKMADTSAVILTGGKSSRMGRPKALLPFDGEPLIAHVVRHLKNLCAETIVVAAPEQDLPPLPALLVRDEVAYLGPVSGIFHGLKASNNEICFVTSCDAPFLNLALIAHLLEQIADCDVVVPFWEERFQPLHAVYRTSCVPFLKDQLQRGELRPIFLYDKVRTRKIQEDEIRRLDPDGLSFLNMNSPEEYTTALQLWSERRSNAIAVTVELFGVARLLAKTKTVSLALRGEATLGEVIAALAAKLPMLLGRVINSEGFLPGYTCNINGLDFVRAPSAKINPGDKIFIISADAGG
jgi:molybdopterin-guanine dinucleotide biosynthesis protein A/molybdopterin converting factor small subunit